MKLYLGTIIGTAAEVGVHLYFDILSFFVFDGGIGFSVFTFIFLVTSLYVFDCSKIFIVAVTDETI